jgi:hypothetical protein
VDSRGSALDAGINDDTAGEDLGPILLCRRYLLEAGCDPTLPSMFESEILGDCCDLWIDFCVPVCPPKQELLEVPLPSRFLS